MRQKAATSSSVSNVAAAIRIAPQNTSNDGESTPLTYQAQLRKPDAGDAPNQQRSVDSASRLASSKGSTRRTSHRTSSSISSENFSDPVLASVSPRKPKAWASSRGPSSLTPPQSTTPTRDQGGGGGGGGGGGTSSSSPSATTNNTIATNNTVTSHSTSTPPSAPPSVTPSPSASQQPVSSDLEPKSPSYYRRSPASRSSHGIETSSGPPPALSTQRSLAQEKSRKTAPDRDNSSNSGPSGRSMAGEPGRKARPSSSSSGLDTNLKKTATTESANATAPERKQHKRSSLPARASSFVSRDKDKMSPTLPRFHGSLRTVSDRTERDESGTDTGRKETTNGEGTKRSDDVFLNIAKDKDTSHRRTNSTRTEIPKTNAGIRGIPSRLQTNRDSTTPPRSEYNLDQHSSSQQADPLSVSHGASTVRSPSSAHPHDETSRLRHFGVNSRASMGHTRSRLSRANADMSSETSQNHPEGHGPVQDFGHSRPYRQSLLGGTSSSRRLSGLDGTERARFEADKPRYDGTESTLSTNAPSTVWDELDDLKSRIKKLEVTGRLPTSSAAAMSTLSGERPRTATTTVTTLSSSPKHARKASSPLECGDGTQHGTNQVQNLLLTALAKAKPRLNPPVYRSLETTATDALALSGILNSSSSQQESGSSSHVNGNVSPDRQMKWKAESLCRGLTELCLALSENQGTPTSNQRPGSRDTSTVRHVSGAETESAAAPNFSYGRSASHEPEDFHRNHGSGNVAASNGLRESRRSSMYNLSNGNQASDEVPDSPSTLQLPTPPARLSRTSMLLRNRRLPPEEQQYDDTQSAVSRPLSRAMTDANISGRDRFSTRDRLAHTHSSPLTTNVEEQSVHDQGQSAVPFRRNFASPSTNLPAAPHTTIQPGFRRYAASNTGARVSVDRTSNEKMSDVMNSHSHSQQEDLQSRGTAPSRSATHHSSMQQLRSRTNSVSGRRIGFRPRQLTVNANNSGLAHDDVD